MLNRRLFLGALAAPAIVSHAVLGQALRKVKLGSAFTTTTNAMFLMPDLLKPEGIDAEIITFPSLVQRMQAVASGAVDCRQWRPVRHDAARHQGLPHVRSGQWLRWRLDAGRAEVRDHQTWQQLAGKKVGSPERLHRPRQPQLEAAGGEARPTRSSWSSSTTRTSPPRSRAATWTAICCFEPYATFAATERVRPQAVGPLRHPDGQDEPRLRRQRPLHQEGPGPDAQAGPGPRDGDQPDEDAHGPVHRRCETTIKQFNMSTRDRRPRRRRTCSSPPIAAPPSRPGSNPSRA